MADLIFLKKFIYMSAVVVLLAIFSPSLTSLLSFLRALGHQVRELNNSFQRLNIEYCEPKKKCVW